MKYDGELTAQEFLEIISNLDDLYRLVSSQDILLNKMLAGSHPVMALVVKKFINLNSLMVENLMLVQNEMNKVLAELLAHQKGGNA